MGKTTRRLSRKNSHKVIHVQFGAGRATSGAREALPEERQRDAHHNDAVTDLFSGTEVCRLIGMSAGRLRSLDRAGIVRPTGRRRGRRAYTFTDVIALKAARELLEQKVRLRDVSRAVDKLRVALPKSAQPLSELRVVSDGRKLIVKTSAGSYEPVSGQMMLDFEIRALQDAVVRVLRPVVGKERARAAYELYLQASQLDENPATMDEAERLYRRALQVDPYLAIAYTNLGNICFRRADEHQAEIFYHKALEIDAHQPEAQYNLGYLILEQGQPDIAVGCFRGAIKSDPLFADAYFNLAMAYEQLGDASKARPCWRKYLDLEPTGTWAEIAKKHL